MTSTPGSETKKRTSKGLCASCIVVYTVAFPTVGLWTLYRVTRYNETFTDALAHIERRVSGFKEEWL